MFETSHIELSRSALRKNLRFLRRQLPKRARFSSVIKGNAYGHGVSLFVPMAERCGVRHFSVFSADEALAAYKTRVEKSEIMIMGEVAGDALTWAVDKGVAFFVFEEQRLKQALRAAKRVGRPARVHLELETGLHRTGLESGGLRRSLKLIQSNPLHLLLEGVCTHYAGAESLTNYLRIQQQIESFKAQCQLLTEAGLALGVGGALRHTACSAAALTYPETVMEMARIGIAQYGFWPSKETEIQYYANRQPKRRRRADPLSRVIRWSSRVMSVKKIKRGDYVGYGTSSLATRASTVAAVPVGYFHGFSRDLSNRGNVLIRGCRALVTGIVNMNMVLVDVTDIPGVRQGDEVVIIGKQGERTISVGAFGELNRVINYEILVRIPSEIPRVVVD
jgi:alanine racemase